MTPETRAAATEMLPTPKAHTLTDHQINGITCVWCAKQLGNNGVKLGPRLRVANGGIHRWKPRGCKPCTGQQAARVYTVHVKACARCSHRDYCPDSHALHALALEYQ